MNSQPIMETRRLLLRPFAKSDALTVQRLAGDERVALMTEHIPQPYEADMAEDWISNHLSEWDAGTRTTFAICRRDSADVIGCVSLTIAPQHRRANLGYWIGYDFWGSGFCSEAAEATVRFGFSRLKLVRIQATHLVRNPASGAVMRKIGMQHEGTLRSHVVNCGRSQDLELYSILSTD